MLQDRVEALRADTGRAGVSGSPGAQGSARSDTARA